MEKIGGQVAKPGLGYFLWTFSLLAWDDNASLGMYVKVCLIHCLISVAVMVIGGFIGVKARKAKDAKMAAQAKETDGTNAGEV